MQTTYTRTKKNEGLMILILSLSSIFIFTFSLQAQTPRVGMGCTNPTTTLELRGTEADLLETMNNTNVANRSSLQFQSNGTTKFRLGLDNNDNILKIGTTALGTNTRLGINTNGNLGIGLANGIQKVHIQETGASNLILTLDQTNAGDYDNIVRFENGTTNWSMGMRDVDADQFSICENADLSANVRFLIKTNGNVGIGQTNTAATRLDINFTTAATDGILFNQIHATGNSIIDWQLNSVSKFKMGIDNTNNDAFEITAGNFSTTPAFAIKQSNATVGLGTDSPKSAFDVRGSQAFSCTSQGAGSDYTATTTDYFILMNTSSARTLNLPAAASSKGMIYIIKRNGGNNLTIDPNASEKIVGATTLVLTSDKQSVMVICDGTVWQAIGKK